MPRELHNFLLTIPHFDQVDVVETILKHEFLCKQYIISTEEHHEQAESILEQNAQNVQRHIHSFFKLDDGPGLITDLSSIRERLHRSLQAVAGEENAPPGFDIQACKRPDKCITYITKVI